MPHLITLKSAPPGTLHHLTPAQAQAFAAGHAAAHGWGLAETLALARQVGHPLPGEIPILGVEAGLLDPGEGLSPAVRRALPQVLTVITAWVQAHFPTPEGPPRPASPSAERASSS